MVTVRAAAAIVGRMLFMGSVRGEGRGLAGRPLGDVVGSGGRQLQLIASLQDGPTGAVCQLLGDGTDRLRLVT